jgi:hypothetical protein
MDSLLQKSVQRAFETLTFNEISDWRILNFNPAKTEERVCSSIYFYKPVCGLLEICLERSQCREFVETISGIEINPQVQEEIILQDFLGEIINSIAGCILTELSEGREDIQLGLPSPGENEMTAFSPVNGTLIYTFTINEKTGFIRIE